MATPPTRSRRTAATPPWRLRRGDFSWRLRRLAVGETLSSRPKHPTRGRRRLRAPDHGEHPASLSATRSHRAAFAPALPFSDGVASARNRARLGPRFARLGPGKCCPSSTTKPPLCPPRKALRTSRTGFAPGPAGRQAQPLTWSLLSRPFKALGRAGR